MGETKELWKFKYKNYAPPGGIWFYVTPESSQYFESRTSLIDLQNKVFNHYSLNNKPVPENLKAIIEDYMCHNIPGNFCEGGENPNVLDMFTVLKLSELLFRRIVSRDFFVTAKQADDRARTCTTCRMNLKHMCTACNGLRETFRKLVANRKTPYDPGLGVCGACGCGLAAKVHIARKYLADNPNKRLDYPDNCWMVTELRD